MCIPFWFLITVNSKVCCFADSDMDCNILYCDVIVFFFILYCDTVSGLFRVLIVCIVIVYCDTLTEVFSVFFPQLQGKWQGITRQRRDTARSYTLL